MENKSDMNHERHARTLINVIDCGKTYSGNTPALERTSLQIEPGEVLALLGPSGCGKTTLLRVIAGLVSPDHGGRIQFSGDDVTDMPIERRNVGMVFQHYALFPHMTVEANIGYGLKIRHVSKEDIRKRVGELIDLVRLGGLEKRRPAELSGGQRQRVALARAVAVRPRVLLLDEPLTALDAKLKEALRDELAELLRRLNITAIHVTHDQQEAMAIADRLAVMQAGRIVQIGDGESLYRRPAHPFVAEFLGRVNRIARCAEDVAVGLVRVAGQAFRCPEAFAAQAELLLRPEDVQLQNLQLAAGNKMDGGIARVIRRIFLGERLHFHLQAGDGANLICETSNDAPYQIGDTVRVIINIDRLMPAALSI